MRRIWHYPDGHVEEFECKTTDTKPGYDWHVYPQDMTRNGWQKSKGTS